MNVKRIFLFAVACTFVGARTALANQPPSPLVGLPMIAILPVMMVLTLLGGGYEVFKRVRSQKSKRGRGWILTVTVVVVIFLSFMHEAFAAVLALVFGAIAAARGLKLIFWGVQALKGGAQAVRAGGAKLVTSGIVLIPLSLFLMGFSISFVGYWPMYRLKTAMEGYEQFVAYQLHYAAEQRIKNGEVAFDEITKDTEDVSHLPRQARELLKAPYFKVEYATTPANFTAFLLPVARFPVFPYNLFTSQPSYRATQTGQIHAIQVHRAGKHCPPDAPVVMRLTAQDFTLKSGHS